MKGFVLVAMAVAATAVVGVCVVRAMGGAIHVGDMALAGGVLLAAGMGANVPVMLARGGDQVAVSQAALAGLMVHLFVAAGAGGAMLMAKVVSGPAYTYWLLAFYAATLCAVVSALVSAVKRAPGSVASRGAASAPDASAAGAAGSTGQ